MIGLILITQRVEIFDCYNERRDSLDQKWIEFILRCGFLPLICPNNITATKLLLKEINVTGIILSGGNNLNKYGGEALERDILERYLVEHSMKYSIPLIGVCRGMQVIMDYFNIKLIKITNHVKTYHILNYKNTSIKVNSFHSLGALETNNEIYVECRAEDGVFEKIKHINYNIYGIMWHPERNVPFDDNDVRIFKEIFSGN